MDTMKTFDALEKTLRKGRARDTELSRIEFGVDTSGKVFHNGLNLVHGCVVSRDGFRFSYRDTQKAGRHFAIIKTDGTYVGRALCARTGNYVVSVTQDYLGATRTRCRFDSPIELETDPIRLALRNRGIYPASRMIAKVRAGTLLAYTANKAHTGRSKAPAGAHSIAFTSDGVECVEEKASAGIKEGPVTGKVAGATFLIQYSTVFGRRGRPRRWIEKITVTEAVEIANLEKALDAVMNTKARPAQLLQVHSQPEDPQVSDESSGSHEPELLAASAPSSGFSLADAWPVS